MLQDVARGPGEETAQPPLGAQAVTGAHAAATQGGDQVRGRAARAIMRGLPKPQPRRCGTRLSSPSQSVGATWEMGSGLRARFGQGAPAGSDEVCGDVRQAGVSRRFDGPSPRGLREAGRDAQEENDSEACRGDGNVPTLYSVWVGMWRWRIVSMCGHRLSLGAELAAH